MNEAKTKQQKYTKYNKKTQYLILKPNKKYNKKNKKKKHTHTLFHTSAKQKI